MFKTALPVLGGDGSVEDTTDAYAQAVKSGTVIGADYKRGNTTLNVLRRNPTDPEPYHFFLLHLNEVDHQGHNIGTDTAHKLATTPDSENDLRYYVAVGQIAAILKEVIAAVPNDTVVVLTADHGHVDSGGHGGLDEHLQNVPFVVYKRGSGFKTKTGLTSRRFPSRTQQVQNIDVPGTVCAMLGINVPRHNQGVYIEEMLHFTNPSKLGWLYRVTTCNQCSVPYVYRSG
jgi:hypothetical protein